MFKELLLEEIIRVYKETNKNDGPIKILEMGSGTSAAIRYILEKSDSDIIYTGIEPSNTIEVARKNLKDFKNVTLRKEFGYHADANEQFDIVLSLSVLEHVKNLSSFIETSARYARKGGMVVHLYDLGHSLYPGSLKERFQVFLGNNLPFLLSELKFVRYVSPREVSHLCEKYGLSVTHISYHQMPSHKAFIKQLKKEPAEVLQISKAIFECEALLSKNIENTIKKELLFPSVCVWSTKN